MKRTDNKPVRLHRSGVRPSPGAATYDNPSASNDFQHPHVAAPADGRTPGTEVRASVLVGLLWCVAILSVLVIGVLRTARMDLLVVKNHGDVIQAHYLALAGIEKAKALLYRDARERKRNAKNHSGELYDTPHHFRDVA